MNKQPTLENKLVLIRPLSANDYDELYLAASDPTIWEQHTTTDRWTPEGFKVYFDDAVASKGALVIIDKATNTIIGSSRYYIEEGITDAVEIGWTFLAKAYWGGTYNKSFKTLMIEHGLQSKINVLFLIAMENIRSQKATEKLGGLKINKVDYPLYFRKEKTHHTYCINKHTWNQLG